jgi:hypothetical protein
MVAIKQPQKRRFSRAIGPADGHDLTLRHRKAYVGQNIRAAGRPPADIGQFYCMGHRVIARAGTAQVSRRTGCDVAKMDATMGQRRRSFIECSFRDTPPGGFVI